MTLTIVKNLLFGSPFTDRRTPSSTASGDTMVAPHTNRTLEHDPERQPLLDGTGRSGLKVPGGRGGDENEDQSSPSRRFKIDARIISDATIGLSDGLTVPFALTAGLSALGQTKVVVYGGLAELIAGAISMGLGGYLGAKSEAASYRETHNECALLASQDPNHVRTALRSVFEAFDFPTETITLLSDHLAASPSKQADFLMRFQHCELEPAANRAAVSALTIAAGYLLGGLVPLMPYFFVSGDDGVRLALGISVLVMIVALFAFGYAKTCAVCGWKGSSRVWQGVVGGLEMVVVGGAAAGAAMGLVKAFDGLAKEGETSGMM